MNMNRRIKPNLIDPKITRKISRTINPPEKDYWGPTKSTAQAFYENYIKPNFYFFILVILFICFLIYRYRIVQDQRFESEYIDMEQLPLEPAKPITYTDMLMDIYKTSKELSYEPKINTSKRTNRVEWAQGTNQNDNLNRYNQFQPKFAYPIYPYKKGGSLKK